MATPVNASIDANNTHALLGYDGSATRSLACDINGVLATSSAATPAGYAAIQDNNQVSIASAATAVAVPTSAAAARKEITLVNMSATDPVYFGKTGVTAATGVPLYGHQAVTLPLAASAPVYVYQASGGAISVAYIEL